MELSIVEEISKTSKRKGTLFRVRLNCSKCGIEMVVAMKEKFYNDCQEPQVEIYCRECGIKLGEIDDSVGGCYIINSPELISRGVRPDNYYKYLQTKEWKCKRKNAIEKAGGRCQLCNRGEDSILHVHHRTYENVGDEAPGDLIVLCGRCHAKFHDILT